MTVDKYTASYRHHLLNLVTEFQIAVVKSKRERFSNEELIEKTKSIASRVIEITNQFEKDIENV